MEGIWPLVILWVLALLLGGGKKKRPPATDTEGTESGEALKEEVERLRQVEEEARRRLEQRRKQPARTAATRKRKVEPKVYHPRQRPAAATAPGRVEIVIEDPAVTSLEGLDYDREAERVVEARRRAAEGRPVSAEELTEAQRSRRAVQAEAPPDDEQRHAAFHGRLAAAAAPVPAAGAPSRRSPLGRFADGSPRSAIILATIIGRPIGDR